MTSAVSLVSPRVELKDESILIHPMINVHETAERLCTEPWEEPLAGSVACVLVGLVVHVH